MLGLRGPVTLTMNTSLSHTHTAIQRHVQEYIVKIYLNELIYLASLTELSG